MRPFPATRPIVATLAAAIAVGGLSACASTEDDKGGSGASGGASAEVSNAKNADAKKLSFTLTDDGCTPSRTTVAAGPVTFYAKNPGTTKTDELELKNEDGIILGERENLVPGLDAEFTLTMKPGKYVLNCSFQNEQRDNGTVTVTGEAEAPASDAPDATLAKAVSEYKTYVEAESGQLVKDVTAFTTALKAGDTQKAKDLFGPARVHYESIEPIAESFGDLDPEIDARANDVADKDTWTGFHKIEQILFTKNTTKGTSKFATKLLADVKTLDSKIPGLKLQAAQIANGAIGLLDEVSNSKISGEEDRYSHTDLSDFQANFDGAMKAFDVLKPALKERGEGELVTQVERQAADLQKGLDRYRRDTPLKFALYEELTDADRKTFAQQVASLAEPMSLVAGKVLD